MNRQSVTGSTTGSSSGIWTVCALFLCWVPPAWAQDKPAESGVSGAGAGIDCQAHQVAGPAEPGSPKVLKQAAKLAKKASKACRQKNYKTCIEMLSTAYGQAGDSALLSELGLAHERAGSSEPAICLYRQYLGLAGEASDRARVDKRMKELVTQRQAWTETLSAQERTIDCTSRQWPAPSAPVDRKAARKARKVADQANGQCQRGNYIECANAYRAAFDIDGAASHLRAAGRAYEGMADHERSVCAYRQYVDASARTDTARKLISAAVERLVSSRSSQEDIQRDAQAASDVQCEDYALTPPAEDARDAKRASKLADSAARSCRNKKWIDCVNGYREAFTVGGQPDHLRTLGRAYAGSRDLKGAVCSYRQHRTAAPDSPYGSWINENLASTYVTFRTAEKNRSKDEKTITEALEHIDCSGRRIAGTDPSKVSKSTRNRVYGMAQRALRICRQQRYDECIGRLSDVYRLDGNPTYLLSIANQYVQLKAYDKAICVYDQFLSSSPPAQFVAGTRRKLAELSADYNETRKAQSDLKQAQAEFDDLQKRMKEMRLVLEEEEQKRHEAEDQVMRERKVFEETTEIIKKKGRSKAGGTQRYIGLGLLGAGALSVGMGVLAAMDANRTQNTIESATAWGQEFDAMLDHGESVRTRAWILSAAGGTALIGGAVLYWLGERASRKLEVPVPVPTHENGTTSMVFRGHF